MISVGDRFASTRPLSASVRRVAEAAVVASVEEAAVAVVVEIAVVVVETAVAVAGDTSPAGSVFIQFAGANLVTRPWTFQSMAYRFPSGS